VFPIFPVDYPFIRKGALFYHAFIETGKYKSGRSYGPTLDDRLCANSVGLDGVGSAIRQRKTEGYG
jgi:hypothetical protein